jgi:hypothetical protein
MFDLERQIQEKQESMLWKRRQMNNRLSSSQKKRILKDRGYIDEVTRNRISKGKQSLHHDWPVGSGGDARQKNITILDRVTHEKIHRIAEAKFARVTGRTFNGAAKDRDLWGEIVLNTTRAAVELTRASQIEDGEDATEVYQRFYDYSMSDRTRINNLLNSLEQ